MKLNRAAFRLADGSLASSEQTERSESCASRDHLRVCAVWPRGNAAKKMVRKQEARTYRRFTESFLSPTDLAPFECMTIAEKHAEMAGLPGKWEDEKTQPKFD